jgi:hypothetical protein
MIVKKISRDELQARLGDSEDIVFVECWSQSTTRKRNCR